MRDRRDGSDDTAASWRPRWGRLGEWGAPGGVGCRPRGRRPRFVGNRDHPDHRPVRIATGHERRRRRCRRGRDQQDGVVAIAVVPETTEPRRIRGTAGGEQRQHEQQAGDRDGQESRDHAANEYDGGTAVRAGNRAPGDAVSRTRHFSGSSGLEAGGAEGRYIPRYARFRRSSPRSAAPWPCSTRWPDSSTAARWASVSA